MKRLIKLLDIFIIFLFNMAIGMPWFLSFLTAGILFVGIYSFRVYDSEHMESYNEQIIRTIVGTIIGFVIILLFYVFIPQYINRFIFIYNFIFALIALPIIHITEYKIYIKRKLPTNYLVIGKKEEMEDILEEISKKTLNKKRFVEFINPSPTRLDKIVEERILNEDIRDKARDNKKYKYKKNIQQKIDRILVADPYLEELVKPKLKEYKRKGIKVEYLPNMVEKDLKRIPIKVAEKFKKYYEVAFEQIEESPGKRILDIFISTVSLIILSPFLLIISLIILLEDKLPIVFRQERVGINENPFTMHKFRSMKNEDKSKAKFASDEQHRILKIGKIMRPIRLDETLQFIDIFRGVMSFVGPRPEQLKFVKEYNELIPFYYARHKLKPGLTGWAQIMYQYAATLEQSKKKLSYDLYYVKNRNSVLDIQIILKTVEAVVWKRGAM